jgi:hypothetical protein
MSIFTIDQRALAIEERGWPNHRCSVATQVANSLGRETSLTDFRAGSLNKQS